MRTDALQEVRYIRHKISEEQGHDVHKVAAYYRQVEQELKESGDFHFEELSDETAGVTSQRTETSD